MSTVQVLIHLENSWSQLLFTPWRRATCYREAAAELSSQTPCVCVNHRWAPSTRQRCVQVGPSPAVSGIWETLVEIQTVMAIPTFLIIIIQVRSHFPFKAALFVTHRRVG